MRAQELTDLVHETIEVSTSVPRVSYGKAGEVEPDDTPKKDRGGHELLGQHSRFAQEVEGREFGDFRPDPNLLEAGGQARTPMTTKNPATTKATKVD